jgi:acetylornithine/succinyldiaminopimelate/putrescine aminotransferase
LLTTREIFDRAYGTHTTAEAHGSTFSGNALCAVAGLAVTELINDTLLERVQSAGTALSAALSEALRGLPLVQEVRGCGLLVGIRLNQPNHPWFSFESMGLSELAGRPSVGLMLCHRLYRAGFLVNVGAHDWNTVRVHPPLNISNERLQAFVQACASEVQFLCNLM